MHKVPYSEFQWDMERGIVITDEKKKKKAKTKGREHFWNKGVRNSVDRVLSERITACERNKKQKKHLKTGYFCKGTQQPSQWNNIIEENLLYLTKNMWAMTQSLSLSPSQYDRSSSAGREEKTPTQLSSHSRAHGKAGHQHYSPSP